MTGLLFRDVEVNGIRADVRVEGDMVVEIGRALPRRRGEATVEGRSGALLPGLHDHHLHLLATAASRESLACGPPAVADPLQLSQALQSASPGRDGWIRGVDYHESVAGSLDRWVLDKWVAETPVRIQHRSGALWVLNSAGVRAVAVQAGDVPDGVELDADGKPTGRLWRADIWLRDRIGPTAPPDLAAVGRALARAGVTGVSDATPELAPTARDLLIDAAADGRLPQRLCLLGLDDTPGGAGDRVFVGARKLVLADHDLPDLPTLVDTIRRLRRTGQAGKAGRRSVAVHCVTRLALVLLLAALEHVGTVPGDRVEHAAVVPSEVITTLRRLGITVVTQPSFIAKRGDDYLREVDTDDLRSLYRCRSLLDASVPVSLSSDAPYGLLDPWATIRAATTRQAPSGMIVGNTERITADTALDRMLTPLGNAGGPPRTIEEGTVADLCLLRAPRQVAAREPRSGLVRQTLVGGRVVHDSH